MNKLPLAEDKRSFALLRRQSGITLIESLVLVLVLAVLIISVYLGIIYAERQLHTNYRDRVATLLVTGEMEMEYYRHSRSKPFEMQVNKTYVLDDRDPDNKIMGKMTMTIRNAKESSNEQLLDYKILEGTLRWTDPASKKERYIRMREDYFIP